jgi:hypothetical protein
MAQLAPESGATVRQARRRPGTAPQLPEGRAPGRRGRTPAAWRLPLLLGVVYGLWVFQMDRGGPAGRTRYAYPITTGDVLAGVISGLVVAALAFLLHRVRHRLPRAGRALGWAALAGLSLGWLYSLSHASVLRTVILALGVAAGTYLTTWYRYHTSEIPARGR